MAAGLMLFAGCAGANPPNHADLPTVSSDIAEIIESGELGKLQKFVDPVNITFRDGQIDEGIGCFLAWRPSCGGQKSVVSDILAHDHFIYYHHIDPDNVIVSYVRSSARERLYANPEAFLEDRYLKDYFSCQLVRKANRWLLKESVCFAETEGPFSPDPDV